MGTCTSTSTCSPDGTHRCCCCGIFGVKGRVGHGQNIWRAWEDAQLGVVGVRGQRGWWVVCGRWWDVLVVVVGIGGRWRRMLGWEGLGGKSHQSIPVPVAGVHWEKTHTHRHRHTHTHTTCSPVKTGPPPLAPPQVPPFSLLLGLRHGYPRPRTAAGVDA